MGCVRVTQLLALHSAKILGTVGRESIQDFPLIIVSDVKIIRDSPLLVMLDPL